jgi:hypothetical protein
LTLRLVKGYVPFPGIKGVVKKNLLKDGEIRHHVFLVALHGPTLSFLCRRFRAFKFCLKTEKNTFSIYLHWLTTKHIILAYYYGFL